MSRAPQRSDARLVVEVAATVRHGRLAAPLLTRAARATADACGFRRGHLSIAVVGARRMATLHRRHRDEAGATDVLTFDFGSDRRRGVLDAEIVVCADVARRAAKQPTPQQTRAELALYVVHGLLHIAGYDDHETAAARRMHAREDQLLTRLGLGPLYSDGQHRRAKRGE